jgi:bifunctional DNA-binding transcriptional regulator/antitoxin component of YhaV-PrlF toxin-antitoxin module
MVIVEMDERYRLTLPREVREAFKVSKGQKFYIIAMGDVLLIKRMPQDPPEALRKLLGEFTFDREARRKAERWLLSQVEEKS